MTIQQEFVEWIDALIRGQMEPIEPSDNVQAYLDALRNSTVAMAKPDFTENGKAILQYLQSVPATMYKSKDIAEGMFISSKAVSGAMRKLVTDGYVEKIGQNPVVYKITEKGMNVVFEIEGENE